MLSPASRKNRAACARHVTGKLLAIVNRRSAMQLHGRKGKRMLINKISPIKTKKHAKINERHERDIVFSVRLVTTEDLFAYLQSLPACGPGYYADYKFEKNKRICLQHPCKINVGVDLRVRLTVERYRNNFWESRVSFEPLDIAVKDPEKWNRIPRTDWESLQKQIISFIGYLPK